MKKLQDTARLQADPTPEEIAAACEQIRAGWPPQEFRRRSEWAYTARVTVTEASDSDHQG